jgi:hypothetical protein
VFKNK